VRTVRLTVVVTLVAVTLTVPDTAAQSLTLGLFERYLESLRQESAIPGLSAAIVQNGRVEWDRGFGLQDVENSIFARADTPYPVADLSQTLASTLLLRLCVERRDVDIDDPITRWIPQFPEAATTVGHILTHASPSDGFRYDPSRYAASTVVIEQCASQAYRKIVAEEVLVRFGMSDSVPGHQLAEPSAADHRLFDEATLARYANVIRRLAVPYRVDGRGKASRSIYPSRSMDASTGLISTVRDLARFDAALDDGALIHRDMLNVAWSNRRLTNGTESPMGLGWFVQTYNDQRIVWHFGLAEGAFSSLILKVPGRNLTLILLANSDGLSAPFPLKAGDVTKSLFARLFLRLFVG
jgi:CubicO group peptidase (beta-lactamase class C family)